MARHSIYAMKLKHLYDLYDSYESEKKLQYFTDGGPFAIYGAGKAGIKMAEALKVQFGVIPLAYIDRKAEEAYYIDNIPVYSVDKCFALLGDIPVGVAVETYFTGEEKEKINKNLISAGFSKINNILTPDPYPTAFLYLSKIDRKKTISVIDMLHDNASKEQYYSYIYSRAWKTIFYALTYPPSSGYCATDLFRLGEKDHALDCGGYDGDTVRQLIQNYPKLRYITVFEPDQNSYKKIQNLFQNVSEDIRIVPKAVSNTNGPVGFISLNSVASRVDYRSNDKIISCRIDDTEFDMPPSFIKMDVEGAELDALYGARETIVKYHPILAISLYHKAPDIYEIPLFVRELYPDYRLFVRKNEPAHASFDFNMFAIPPERLL
ncbi:MAG: FkbM family methyltransferase [Fibromonadales bacterium]|nr:FkbM family methyltransferase [Fibromonadales bacterium]